MNTFIKHSDFKRGLSPLRDSEGVAPSSLNEAVVFRSLAIIEFKTKLYVIYSLTFMGVFRNKRLGLLTYSLYLSGDSL